MTAIIGTKLATANSLVLHIDAGNPRSYDSRENLLTYSEQLDNASGWQQQTSTVTSNVFAAPDGTMTADSISSATDIGVYQQQTVLNATTYTASIYVNLAASTATSIMLRDMGGTSPNGHHIVITTATATLSGAQGITSSGITNVGNGWYRVWITYVTDTTTLQLTIRPNSQAGTTTVVAWGAQVEKGSAMSAYAPTTTTAITRSTTWVNLANTTNSGTMTSCQYHPANGGHIIFDPAANSFVTMANQLAMNKAGATMIMWLQRTDNAKRSFLTYDPASYNNHLHFDYNFTNDCETNSNCNTFDMPSVAYFSTTNTWMCVAFKFTADQQCTWYINGEYGAKTTNYGSINCSTNYTTKLEDHFIWQYIGHTTAYTVGTNNRFYGKLGMLMQFGRDLTDVEIRQNFNAHRGRFGI